MVPFVSHGSNDMSTNQTAVWKSSTKGSLPVTEMATPHIANAISKVRAELAESTVTDRTGKESILSALETEYSTRSDATTTA